jgi:hypothetical protein
VNVGGNFTSHTQISVTAETLIIQSPSSSAPRSALSQPSLTWFPLADAFEESGPNLFSLLRWDFRLVQTLHGREDDLRSILDWAQGGSNTPTAQASGLLDAVAALLCKGEARTVSMYTLRCWLTRFKQAAQVASLF